MKARKETWVGCPVMVCYRASWNWGAGWWRDAEPLPHSSNSHLKVTTKVKNKGPIKPTMAEPKWSGSPWHDETAIFGIASNCFWLPSYGTRCWWHQELPVQGDGAGRVSQAPGQGVLEPVPFSPCITPEKQNKRGKKKKKSHKGVLYLMAPLVWITLVQSLSVYPGPSAAVFAEAHSHLTNASGSHPCLQLLSKQL